MAAAQLEEKKKNNDDSSPKMGVRVVPIPAVSPIKGFVCTATGLIIPGKALFVGHLPFISPFAALVFFVNMGIIDKGKLAQDAEILSRLKLTPRFIAMCISYLLSSDHVNLELVDSLTAGTRGKRSPHTEFCNRCREAALQIGLSYKTDSSHFVPIANCINQEDPVSSYLECLHLINNLLKTGRELEERYEWKVPAVSVEAYQEKQRTSRKPKPYMVFKCAEQSNDPLEVVSDQGAPFEEAFDFFKKLIGSKGSYYPIEDPKTPSSKRFAGVAEDNTRYLCTNRYHKDHVPKSSSSSSSSLTSSNDDGSSDGELSQPVEDD